MCPSLHNQRIMVNYKIMFAEPAKSLTSVNSKATEICFDIVAFKLLRGH